MKTKSVMISFYLSLSFLLYALPNIAVLDAVLPEKMDKNIGVGITEKISEEFVKTGKFTVLDRTTVDQSLKEIEFQLSGLVSDTEINRAGDALGMRLGASFVVIARVSLVADTYFVTAKMIEIATGQITAQSSGEDEGKASVTLGIAQRLGKEIAGAREVRPAVPDQPKQGEVGTGTLKVAIITPLTGALNSYGPSLRDGALLAIDEWNARGGALGERILPIVADSQSNPNRAMSEAKRLIGQEKVGYIIGEVSSNASMQVSEVANLERVIQICPIATNSKVTVDSSGKTKQFVFRACFIDPFQGRVGASFAFNNLRAKTAFIIYDKANGFMKEVAEAFQDTFIKLGGKISGKADYSTGGNSDFASILTSVKKSKAAVLFAPEYLQAANSILRQAKAVGLTAPIIGTDAWDSPELDMNAAAGCYFISHFSASDGHLEVRDFLEAFGAAYSDTRGVPARPDSTAALGYDSANLLLQAIVKAGTDDPIKVSADLGKIIFNGVTGQIIFDSQHNPQKPAVVMKVLSDGVKFVTTISP